MFAVTAQGLERAGTDMPAAAEQIAREVASGKLDVEAPNAVMTACGAPRRPLVQPQAPPPPPWLPPGEAW